MVKDPKIHKEVLKTHAKEIGCSPQDIELKNPTIKNEKINYTVGEKNNEIQI